MNIDDKILMAYVDGELAEPERADVEHAMARDATVAARIAGLRALSAQLSAAMAGELSEPMPERLLNAVRTAPSGSAGIIDLNSRRSTQLPRALPRWSALAASALLGGLIAAFGMRLTNDALLALAEGHLMARGELARALEQQPGGVTADARVQISLSFKDVDGRYCRAFGLHERNSSAGLACRDAGGWSVDTLVPSTTNVSNSGEMRTAASPLPAQILQIVDARMNGEALDKESEQKAMASGWRQ